MVVSQYKPGTNTGLRTEAKILACNQVFAKIQHADLLPASKPLTLVSQTGRVTGLGEKSQYTGLEPGFNWF